MISVVQLAEEIYREENPELKMDCPSCVYELVEKRFRQFIDGNRQKIKQFCKTGSGCIECDFTGHKKVYNIVIKCESCNHKI